MDSSLFNKLKTGVFYISLIGMIVCFVIGAILIIPSPGTHDVTQAEMGNNYTVTYQVDEISPDDVRGDYINYDTLNEEEQRVVDEVINEGSAEFETASNLPSTSRIQTVAVNGNSYVLKATISDTSEDWSTLHGIILIVFGSIIWFSFEHFVEKN